MSLRIGLVSAAHVHTPSYAHQFANHERTTVSGVWDDDAARGKKFAADRGLRFFAKLDDLLDECDAVAISSENNKHADHIQACANAKKPIICEKPVVAKREEFDVVRRAVNDNGIKFMTAFPCRFSPAYQALRARVQSGEVGTIRAINATNRGTCPGRWFTDPSLSGGGAMIDHVVHVADLLRDLLGQEPSSVYAQIGNNMYGQVWDDTAMVSLEYPSGVFATLDSSWSRPPSFKTWGDVTMKIVGDDGVLNLDMFGQGIDLYRNDAKVSHGLAGYGSDMDGAMVEAFIRSVLDNEPIAVTLEDGLAAVSVSLRAYEATKRKETVGVS
ncbi:MAG: Gfo/Idh/MocA family oxidoreductase [Armatimonadetes bacterium]|nr:Gfo/Idh/MocA family oxidoreductase [Armatimonadota bacterium]